VEDEDERGGWGDEDEEGDADADDDVVEKREEERGIKARQGQALSLYAPYGSRDTWKS